MGVYIYQSGVEKEMQNAYIGEVWTPGSNTVLYYSFDDDKASLVKDSIGNNNGTWYNNSGSYETGVSGKCAEFTSNINKYISIPTTFTFPTTNFTISFFARFTESSNTSHGFLSKFNGSNSTNAYLYIYQINGKVGTDIPYVATLWETTNTYNDGNWHHIAVTKEGSSYKLWIDGVNTNSATNSFAIHGGSSTQALLGRSNASNLYGIYGDIDEFIIENIAWSQADLDNYLSYFSY